MQNTQVQAGNGTFPKNPQSEQDRIAQTVQQQQPQIPNRYLRRHNVILGESLPTTSTTPLNITPKSQEVRDMLGQSLKTHPLFSHLDDDQKRDVFDVMFEMKFAAGSTIIKQGDEGDNFYVVGDGICDVYVQKDNSEPAHVMTIGPGGSFGELALIYGSPRAATVKARTDTACWAVDRTTYRRILMDTTMKKRQLYEHFLEGVPLLQSMTKYERVTVADVVDTVHFNDGDVILRQGDAGDTFFIIVEGKVKVTKKNDAGVEVQVGSLKVADYFGEIALLTNKPRAASIIADGPVKCIRLDRARFNRVLGSCEDILRRNMEAYNRYMPLAQS